MNLYPESYDVTVGVAFTDLNGQPVVPSAVTAILYDGEDQLVHDFGVLTFAGGDTSVNVVIDAAYNALGAGELQAARVLRVVITTDAGEIRRSSSYIIQGEKRLSIMDNSFMSIEVAEITARDTPNLDGWAAATDDQKYAGLINAYNKLTRIPMRFITYKVEDTEHCYPIENIVIWGDITFEQFQGFPASFRRALRQAQLCQADAILENDPIAKRQRAGIISETVGESSVMLRGGQLSLDVDSRAAECLKGYIYYNLRTARA